MLWSFLLYTSSLFMVFSTSWTHIKPVLIIGSVMTVFITPAEAVEFLLYSFFSPDCWIAAHPSFVLDPTILDASFLAELDAKEIRRKQQAPLLFSDHPLPPELVAFLVKSWMGFSQHANPLQSVISPPIALHLPVSRTHIYICCQDQ
jgi:hypothetical protein